VSSVIIAAPAVWGELAPLLRIGAHLVGRGHEVTVISGSRFADRVRSTGAAFLPLVGAADYDDRALTTDYPVRATLPLGPSQLDFDMHHLFVDAMPVQHRALQTLLAQRPDSILIANSGFTGPWAVALGAPGRKPARWIAIGCNPVTLGTPQATIFGPVPGPDGQVDLIATEQQNDVIRAALEPSRQHLQDLIEAMGGSGTAPTVLDAAVTMPEKFLALTVQGLEFGRTDLPPNVRFAGIMPSEIRSQPLDARIEAAISDPRPLVLVTQGTVANDDLGRLVVPALEGLRNADVVVVAALGKQAELADVPDNAVVVDWVPFDALLTHAAVFITNGGFGGTQRALAFGVPVVVSGGTEGKALVAARVAAVGVGVDLGYENPSPAAIHDAVVQVLDSPEIRVRAGALATEYRALDPLQIIDELLGQPSVRPQVASNA